MGDKTKIEWTEATWNPVRGCERMSEGCRHCYAESVAVRFSGKGQPYEGLAKQTKRGPKWTGEVRLVPEHLFRPVRWKRPRMIFVNSMSDLFWHKIPRDYIAAVFGAMAHAPHHTFQVLTKRPRAAIEFFKWLDMKAEAFGLTPARYCLDQLRQHVTDESERRRVLVDTHSARIDKKGPAAWPLPNVWLGVSVEDQATADKRIPLLWYMPAAWRWISLEPMLAPVDLLVDVAQLGYTRLIDHLDWVVVGGESGPRARPCDVLWIHDVVDACTHIEVPVFVKQLGSNVVAAGEQIKLKDRKGGDIDEWSEASIATIATIATISVREYPDDFEQEQTA